MNTIYLLQVGFFGTAYFVRSSLLLTIVVCVVMFVFMVTTFNTMENDRKFRSLHKKELEKYGFDPLPSKVGLPSYVRRYFSDEQFECFFHASLLGLLAFADVVAVIAFRRGWIVN